MRLFKQFLVSTYLFLLVGVLSQGLIQYQIPSIPSKAFAFGIYGSFIMLIIIFLLFIKKKNFLSVFKPNFSILYVLLIGCVLMMLVVGLLRGAYFSYYILDFCSFLAFPMFIYLGTLPNFWELFDKNLIWVTMVGCVVTVFSCNKFRLEDFTIESIDDLQGGARLLTRLVAYRTQATMTFLPFLLFTLARRKDWEKTVIFLMVVFFVVLQVLFQKRAPTIRWAMYLGLFILLFQTIRDNNQLLKIKGRVYLKVLSVTVAVTIVVFQFIPYQIVTYQFTALMDRYSGVKNVGGSGNVVYYEGGASGVLTNENERVAEIEILLAGFNGIDHIFGKGMGGYFIDTSGEFVRDNNSTLGAPTGSKSVVHIGVSNFFLKGGYIFCFLMFLIFISCLMSNCRRSSKLDARACYYIFVVMTIALVIEGWYYYSSTAFECTIYGLCIGKLNAKNG